MGINASAVAFVLLFVFRYARLLVGIVANLTYKAYPVQPHPRYGARDATVVIPTTFKRPVEFLACVESIHDCNPARILVVTAEAHVEQIRELARLQNLEAIEVLGIEHLNKRHQLLKGLEYVDTEIVVFADDNVIWPYGYLTELLAVFEISSVGAGGTRQHVRRKARPTLWNFLGISYLERRVWNNITTQAVDGSISTLSGRTSAYRTKILKTSAFYSFFGTRSWFGQRLNSDDDKCLTRWLYSNGWQIAIQGSTSIETTLEDGWTYIEQCKRWARSHWRGNFTVMNCETYWRSPSYLWGFYVIYFGQFQTPAIVVDGLLFWLLRVVLDTATPQTQRRCLLGMASWILFTKIIKLIPHFWRYPQDLVFVPVSILFSYLHGIINIHALCTLRNTTWGSQALEQLEKPHLIAGSMMPLLSRSEKDDKGRFYQDHAAWGSSSALHRLEGGFRSRAGSTAGYKSRKDDEPLPYSTSNHSCL